MIKNCADNIKAIDKEIEALIQTDPEYKQMVENLKTVPGVGNMLATHLLVTTDGFNKHLNAKELSSYIGIVPLVYESGKSIRRKNTSSGVGPGRLRKLMYLSSMTSRSVILTPLPNTILFICWVCEVACQFYSVAISANPTLGA
jgi:transposase